MKEPDRRGFFEKDLHASWDIQKSVTPDWLFTAD